MCMHSLGEGRECQVTHCQTRSIALLSATECRASRACSSEKLLVLEPCSPLASVRDGTKRREEGEEGEKPNRDGTAGGGEEWLGYAHSTRSLTSTENVRGTQWNCPSVERSGERKTVCLRE